MNVPLRKLRAWITARRKPLQAAAPAPLTVALVAATVTVVAAIAGIVSYSHIVALGLRTHQGGGDSHLLPFSIDGLIVAGSVILLAGYWLGWLCVGAGVTGTLFANLEFGLPYGWLSAVASTWPAVAFTVATFVLERWLRSRRRQDAPPSAGPGQIAPPVPADSLDAAIAAMIATHRAGNPLSARQVQERFAQPWKVASRVRQLVLADMNGHDPAAAS